MTTSTNTPLAEADGAVVDPEQLRRATLASSVGSALEYYDFYIYGLASALIFGPLFFAPLGEDGALIASFATYGVGFAARPFGGMVFGYIGDRFGRKMVLILTIGLMGTASFAIGLLPTYEQAGMVGAVLLVFAAHPPGAGCRCGTGRRHHVDLRSRAAPPSWFLRLAPVRRHPAGHPARRRDLCPHCHGGQGRPGRLAVAGALPGQCAPDCGGPLHSAPAEGNAGVPGAGEAQECGQEPHRPAVEALQEERADRHRPADGREREFLDLLRPARRVPGGKGRRLPRRQVHRPGRPAHCRRLRRRHGDHVRRAVRQVRPRAGLPLRCAVPGAHRAARVLPGHPGQRHARLGCHGGGHRPRRSVHARPAVPAAARTLRLAVPLHRRGHEPRVLRRPGRRTGPAGRRRAAGRHGPLLAGARHLLAGARADLVRHHLLHARRRRDATSSSSRTPASRTRASASAAAHRGRGPFHQEGAAAFFAESDGKCLATRKVPGDAGMPASMGKCRVASRNSASPGRSASPPESASPRPEDPCRQGPQRKRAAPPFPEGPPRCAR